MQQSENKLLRREDNLNFREENLNARDKKLDEKTKLVDNRLADIDKMQVELQAKIDNQLAVLEKTANMVQIGVDPSRLLKRLDTTSLARRLGSINIGQNGFLFAVNQETGAFSAYPDADQIDRTASQLGLSAAAMSDPYSGFQTLDGTEYFVNGMPFCEAAHPFGVCRRMSYNITKRNETWRII